jgi:arginase
LNLEATEGNRNVKAVVALSSFALLIGTGILQAQQRFEVAVALVKMPYSGARNVPERSGGPDYLEQGGIADVLRSMQVNVPSIETVTLTPEEEKEYGEWHRMGLANRHLADIVAHNHRQGYLNVGLLANCTSLLGVLAGLQHAGPTRRPLKVGLVFIDAHGDFNTPETTLSGMLGGMPVAVAAGMALTNLRVTSGLNPAIPTRVIVMGAVRDLDPLEEDLLNRSEVQIIGVEALRQRSEDMDNQMRRLAETTDLIYVHVDMDVLDPAEVPGHPLAVPNGPTSQQLAAALTEMFQYPTVAALGIASTPAGERDPDGISRRAAYNLIRGAVLGAQRRTASSHPTR